MRNITPTQEAKGYKMRVALKELNVMEKNFETFLHLDKLNTIKLLLRWAKKWLKWFQYDSKNAYLYERGKVEIYETCT